MFGCDGCEHGACSPAPVIGNGSFMGPSDFAYETAQLRRYGKFCADMARESPYEVNKDVGNIFTANFGCCALDDSAEISW